MKRIDRPLFRDFWPRFISSLEALAEKVSAYTTVAITQQSCIDISFLNSGSKDSVPIDPGQGMEY